MFPRKTIYKNFGESHNHIMVNLSIKLIVMIMTCDRISMMEKCQIPKWCIMCDYVPTTES